MLSKYRMHISSSHGVYLPSEPCLYSFSKPSMSAYTRDQSCKIMWNNVDGESSLRLMRACTGAYRSDFREEIPPVTVPLSCPLGLPFGIINITSSLIWFPASLHTSPLVGSTCHGWWRGCYCTNLLCSSDRIEWISDSAWNLPSASASPGGDRKSSQEFSNDEENLKLERGRYYSPR